MRRAWFSPSRHGPCVTRQRLKLGLRNTRSNTTGFAGFPDVWTALAVFALVLAVGLLVEIVAGSIAGSIVKRWME